MFVRAFDEIQGQTYPEITPMLPFKKDFSVFTSSRGAERSLPGFATKKGFLVNIFVLFGSIEPGEMLEHGAFTHQLQMLGPVIIRTYSPTHRIIDRGRSSLIVKETGPKTIFFLVRDDRVLQSAGRARDRKRPVF